MECSGYRLKSMYRLSRVSSRVLLVGIAALLLVTSASAEPTARSGQSASSFMVEVLWNDVRAQYGTGWGKLHPRYQKVTTRAFWEYCQRIRDRDAAGLVVHAVKATNEYAAELKFPLLGTQKVRAVTLEMRYSHPLVGKNRKLTDTVWVVRWGATWKVMWETTTYGAYAKHRCPL
jgi:hypothetical protein